MQILAKFLWFGRNSPNLPDFLLPEFLLCICLYSISFLNKNNKQNYSVGSYVIIGTDVNITHYYVERGGNLLNFYNPSSDLLPIIFVILCNCTVILRSIT